MTGEYNVTVRFPNGITEIWIMGAPDTELIRAIFRDCFPALEIEKIEERTQLT
jgi:hypothetical protein